MSDPSPPEGKSYYVEPVWRRFYAFLLGPALVAAGALAVFTIVSVLTDEGEGPDELVQALQSGGEHRRWQAAFALTKYLQPSMDQSSERLESNDDYQKKLETVRLLVPDLIDIYNDPKKSGPEVQRFLALAFSYLGDARVVPHLTKTLQSDDVELVHYSIAALTKTAELAAIRNEPTPWRADTAAAVEQASRRSEPDIRSTAVFALGVLGGPDAVTRLEETLVDPAPAVRWNSAFALARHKNTKGETVIAEILDRGALYQEAAPDQARQDDLFLNAVRSAGMVRTPMLRERLIRIAKSDENPRARDMAMKILEHES